MFGELFLASVLVAGLVGLGAYGVMQRRIDAARRSNRRSSANSQQELAVGDVVLIGDEDYVVDHVLRFIGVDGNWQEAVLADGRRQRWLVSSSSSTDRSLTFFGHRVDDVPTLTTAGTPPPILVWGDVEYTLARTGEALRLSPPGPGPAAVRPCRYWRYEGPGRQGLWLRHETCGWTCIVGEQIPTNMIETLSAS